MNNYWKNYYPVRVTSTKAPMKETTIELLPVQDLKSIDNFMDFYDKKLLCIGRADGGNYLIIIKIDSSLNKVFLVDADEDIEDVVKYMFVGWNSFDSFINEISKNKK
jgi:hypothetical protein